MLFGKTEKLMNYFSNEEYKVSLKKLGVKDINISLINNRIVTVKHFCAPFILNLLVMKQIIQLKIGILV